MVKLKTNKPIISVVIPAYNEAEFLPRCLESLAKQAGAPNFEVIVVNNNSTDNSAELAKKYGAIVINEPIQGVVAARQAGYMVAKGKILVSTDADSFYKSDWLKNIYSFFKNNPKAVGLAGHYNFYKAPLWAKIMPPMGALLVWLISVFTKKPVYVSAVNLSFKKSAFSGYDTKFPQGADERGVLTKLIDKGRVYITLKNPVYTSSRRVNQGFLHSMIVTIGYYYSYNVWDTKKHGYSKIGSPPAIRTEARLAHLPILLIQWVFLVGITIFIVIAIRRHLYIWNLL